MLEAAAFSFCYAVLWACFFNCKKGVPTIFVNRFRKISINLKKGQIVCLALLA